jgi:hypothetical protein
MALLGWHVAGQGDADTVGVLYCAALCGNQGDTLTVPHAVEGCPQPASKHEEHEAHKHEGPISYSALNHVTIVVENLEVRSLSVSGRTAHCFIAGRPPQCALSACVLPPAATRSHSACHRQL